MQPSPTPVLIRLGDQGKTVIDPREDIRGRRVLDSDGNQVGTIADLLIDDEHRTVRLLRIKHGGFLGIGADEIFVPVEAIIQVDADEVRIDQNHEKLTGAPVYDPELGEDPAYFSELYGYYGIAPYWGVSLPMSPQPPHR